MGHLERGTTNPTMRVLHLVSSALGISVVLSRLGRVTR